MTVPESPPAEVEFATPGNWVAMRLPHTDAEVDALIAETLSGHPELEARRDLVVTVLRTLGQATRVAGCVYAGGAFLPITDGPMPVTLLVNALPLETLGDPPDLRAAATASYAASRRDYVATDVDLPCGPAICAEWFESARLTTAGTSVVSFFTQYFVLPGGAGSLIVLTFSSPAVALAKRLKKLFLDIATSLKVN